jgi:hypothetical protein
MTKVLSKIDVNLKTLLKILQRAGIACELDGDDIDLRSPDCGLYCVRIMPKPEVLEIFKEIPISAPAGLAKQLTNTLNAISPVQWAYLEGTPPGSSFCLARICVSFQHGIIVPQFVTYARDFPSMVSALVGAIGANIDLSGLQPVDRFINRSDKRRMPNAKRNNRLALAPIVTEPQVGTYIRAPLLNPQ